MNTNMKRGWMIAVVFLLGGCSVAQQGTPEPGDSVQQADSPDDADAGPCVSVTESKCPSGTLAYHCPGTPCGPAIVNSADWPHWYCCTGP